jgi:tRNA pseudouridine38-40 synthase
LSDEKPESLLPLTGRKVRLGIEYDGTDFSGWQRQPGQRTVQGSLEDAIRELLREEVTVRAAGRTDAGVHADGQVGSVQLASSITDAGLLRGLNSRLPPDIVITAVETMPAEFDARFSALGKVYRYRIWNHMVRSAKFARTTWHCRSALDIERMREAAALLTGEHDFRGFRSSDCERSNTVRVIHRLAITRQGALVEIDVEATAFLRNMVRILVGTLADVGRGHLDVRRVAHVLQTGDRTAGGVTAPPQGLTLARVFY